MYLSAKKGETIKILSIPNEIIRAQAIRFGISEGLLLPVIV